MLATVNLVIVWAWLIRCAAKNDFLRLGAGLLAGAVIVGTLLFLTPSYCSRSQRLRTGEADSTGKEIEKTGKRLKALVEAGNPRLTGLRLCPSEAGDPYRRRRMRIIECGV